MATEFLVVAEAAEELGLNRQKVLNRITRGKIAGVKRGGIWTIPRSEINRFKKGRTGSAMVYYVYVHITPNGEVFWVGRSKANRLTDIKKGRHNSEYDKVLDLWGKENIRFEVIKQGLSELQASELEKETIALYRRKGHQLTNYQSIQ